MSAAGELPALKNGATWISKFRNIVDYLRQYSNGDWDLDGDLTGLEKADNIACVFPSWMALKRSFIVQDTDTA